MTVYFPMVHAVPNCGFSRTYIVSGRDGLMVIDVGSIGAADDVLAYLNETPGLSADAVRLIAATHFHIDHIGGIGRLLQKCPSTTKVCFHHLVGEYLARRKRLSLITHWLTGCAPASILSVRYVRRLSHLMFESLAGIPVSLLRNLVKLPYGRERIETFGGNQRRRYPLGFDDWEVIETPGHTEDSVSFFNEVTGEMICGDLILNMSTGGTGKLNRFYWNRDCILKSYHDIYTSISPKIIYPGHGEPIRHEENALKGVEAFPA